MDRTNDDLLIHVSRRAMACEFEVRFPAKKYEQGTEWALESLELVDVLEGQISYFQPTSEISRINHLAAHQPVEVESQLFDLLRLTTKLNEETRGAYDITSTPLWEAWGFARRAGSIPSDAQLADAMSLVGGHLVELEPSRRTVRFKRAGVRINLASIGKGFALDVCAERLQATGMNDFLLHGGQSSVLAKGSPLAAPTEGDKLQAPPWEIGIRDPLHPDRRVGIVRLRQRALGTSGSQFQSFRHRGHRYGHILDPRSGRPAEGILSTTVLAPTAALADALSTAFYVMGVERSFEYCRRHPEIGAVLISPTPQGGGIQLHTVGLGTDDWVVPCEQ
jgi:FAD:protein FMN transferase